MKLKINEILIASKNKDKIKEIKSILPPIVVVKSFCDYNDFPDVVEDGKTIEENSRKKAIEIARFFNIPAISDDTGLFVDALGGQPGVFSARWAGEKCSYYDNNIKLLNELKGIKWEDRKAVFKCAITLAKPDGKYVSVVGEVEGYISFEMKGKNGFGYDSVFYLPSYSMTYAEMESDLKNKVSHRAKALELIKPYIEKLIYYGDI